MFKKILVANRGEIALRIMRTCRDMGIETVAVYSKADKDSRVVKLADQAIMIGPPASSKSYLHIPNIIGAAMMTGAEAIHPGYGFLSQDPYFAEICNDHGITFIGPPPEVMEKMGDKSVARRLMLEAGLPLSPGTTEPLVTVDQAREVAGEIGYPVILKASAGGGGRGMTVVWNREDLPQAYSTTRSQAQAFFGNDDVYIEKYIVEPHHVEVQVIGDSFGNVVHLGERDCSIQRRHQKIIEEAPSSILDDNLRQRIGAAAVAGAAAIGYTSAGTMEFLVDKDRNFYFMEMNTRIQVEHPVTEMVTGLDLIELQIRVAAGERLPIRQDDVAVRGHSIECRVNAEDPYHNFAPDCGTIRTFVPPGGSRVRVDTHVYPGYVIPPYYDSLLAKVIVWGADRLEAIDRMRRALGEFEIEGVKTTIPYHLQILTNPYFRKGEFYTDFIERHMSESH